MKTNFESLFEKLVPEINFLSAAVQDIVPGSILESLDKDIVIGYAPNYLGDLPHFKDESFETKTVAYDLMLQRISSKEKGAAALKVLDKLGIHAKYRRDYDIEFNITEVKAKKYKNNLGKIDFELALAALKEKNRDLFMRLKNHILVFEVLYASKYEVKLYTGTGTLVEAEADIRENVEVEGHIEYDKTENSFLISNNEKVPFGVIGYKIKGNKLKEVD